MTHEVIRQEEARLLGRFEELKAIELGYEGDA